MAYTTSHTMKWASLIMSLDHIMLPIWVHTISDTMQSTTASNTAITSTTAIFSGDFFLSGDIGDVKSCRVDPKGKPGKCSVDPLPLTFIGRCCVTVIDSLPPWTALLSRKA